MRRWFPVLLLSLTLPVFGQSVALPGGQSQFTILQNGKTVGHTESNVERVSNGYRIESHGEMSLGRFRYSFTSHNRLDPELNLVRDEITGTVNGKQATFSAESSRDGRQIIIHTEGGGKHETNTVTRHRNLVVMPDFDAAAYLEMVHFAMARPQYSWVLIPKGKGILVPCGYVKKPDVEAAFHGRQTTVRHTTVVINARNAISVELYYDPDGTLMEADLPEQNFYVIRNGFRLVNRPKPTVPHVGTAPQRGSGRG